MVMFSEVYNNTLSQIIQKKGNFFVSGQNVDVGSHISGLSGFLKTLKNKDCVTIFNNPNIETSLLGINMGYMLASNSKKSSCVFVKQADFLTLMVDDLVHTNNLFSALGINYSLNIFTFVVDSGFEGPQSRWSSISSLEDICGIDIIHLHTIDSLKNIELIKCSGIRIFLISQKYFKQPIFDCSNFNKKKKKTIFCLGFSIYDFNNHNEKFKKVLDLDLDYNIIAISNYKTINVDDMKCVLEKDQDVVIVDNSADSNSTCLRFLTYLFSYNIPFSYKLLATKDRKDYTGISSECYEYTCVLEGKVI